MLPKTLNDDAKVHFVSLLKVIHQEGTLDRELNLVEIIIWFLLLTVTPILLRRLPENVNYISVFPITEKNITF